MNLLFLFLFLFQSNTNAFYSEWDSVLQEHVKQGFVDYKGLQNQPENLKQFLEKATNVQKQDFEKWEKKEQLAFYINLYNALTIKLILSEYPVKSIKDIGNFFQGPWSRDVFSLFGNTITLNNLEHDIIRKQFNEPRIHLALVCAAKACPPLRSESYRAEILNELLENQAKNYLSSSNGLVIDEQKETIFISSIFKWYAEDFESVPDFIQKYTSTSIKTYSIRYLDYDWSLNEK
jgi:hypothetical protein